MQFIFVCYFCHSKPYIFYGHHLTISSIGRSEQHKKNAAGDTFMMTEQTQNGGCVSWLVHTQFCPIIIAFSITCGTICVCMRVCRILHDSWFYSFYSIEKTAAINPYSIYSFIHFFIVIEYQILKWVVSTYIRLPKNIGIENQPDTQKKKKTLGYIECNDVRMRQGTRATIYIFSPSVIIETWTVIECSQSNSEAIFFGLVSSTEKYVKSCNNNNRLILVLDEWCALMGRYCYREYIRTLDNVFMIYGLANIMSRQK